jgi:hypothetical protein
MDDTVLLAYGPSTKGNCHTLIRAHEHCLDWACWYGTTFALEKYELIHLAHRPKKFNMQASLQIQGVEQAPKASMRILGVWLDPKLNWGEHVKVVKRKMSTQTNALLRTTASTWGATFTMARQIYSAVVRPALAYGAAVWQPIPQRALADREGEHMLKEPAAKLASVQNRCLRVVAGAYKATPVAALEVETFTPPLDLHIAANIAKFRLRHKQSGMEELVSRACARVRAKIQRRHTPRRTEGECRTQWAEKWLRPGGGSSDITVQQAVRHRWKQRWETRHPEWGLLDAGPPSPRVVKLHKGLRKAESSVITQVRTGRIGLAAFLNKV